MILHVEKKQVNEDTVTLSRVEYLNGIFELLNGLMHPDLRLTSYYIYIVEEIFKLLNCILYFEGWFYKKR